MDIEVAADSIHSNVPIVYRRNHRSRSTWNLHVNVVDDFVKTAMITVASIAFAVVAAPGCVVVDRNGSRPPCNFELHFALRLPQIAIGLGADHLVRSYSNLGAVRARGMNIAADVIHHQS